MLKNSDIEITLLQQLSVIGGFDILITNLTDKVIYLDLGNSFIVDLYGTYNTFFTNSATQVTTGNSKGVGFNIGSLASIFGIGGVVGALAGGTNVGGSSNESTSTITFQERIIAVPPHAKKIIENPSNFSLFRPVSRLRVGEEKIYNEDNTPVKKDYIFTYSTTPHFDNYLTMRFSAYLAKEIGSKFITPEKLLNNITNANGYTLVDVSYAKDVIGTDM